MGPKRSVALQNTSAILLEQRRIEQALSEERERFQITLASIGDAVISTDAQTRIVFLNSIAEALTGWPQPEAAGRPLSDVFHIIHEQTRHPAENPALRALKEGRAIGLAEHMLLIARDGTERPIDYSAAPMRDVSGTTVGTVLVLRDVTERRRAEEAQARLAAIIESSDDAILSKTIDGVIQSWNAGAERLFGYTSDEAIGQPITLIIPPELIDEERSILKRLRNGERIEHFETVRVGKSGRRLDVSLTVSPIRDQQGRIIGASKVGRDITARKQETEALRESEGRHRFLAELAAATQSLTDPREVMKITARMLAEYLEADRCAYAEVEDESVFAITGDHTRGIPSIAGRWPVAAFGIELERCMRANMPYVIADVDSDPRAGVDLTAYRQAHIRAVIWVPLYKAESFAAAMAVHQKTPRRWTTAEIALVQMVANRCWESIERTRVARDLKDAADRLALALSAARLGDWSWDSSTDLVTLSERAAEIFGIPSGPQMTWSKIQALIHEEDRDRARLEVERVAATQAQYDIEYRVLQRGREEVWVSARGRAQYDRSGRVLGIFGVVQDVTERKRLEHELMHRAKDLAETDRKKDDFIALLAHELRNPLAPIRTGLQVMRLAAGDANAVGQARAMMDRQLFHMVRLIDDLLDVSRLTRNKLHLQKTRVLLAEVVSHAVETAGSEVEAAGHELSVSLPSEPLALDADLTRLAQVFGNLLTNSAKYTERGGRIWLTAESRDGDVLVSVRDTGLGIPVDALPRIFDMFSQVDRSVERSKGGLGIGLALVKGLVEMHGGVVTAESRGVGTGSTFIVRLPLAERKSGPYFANAVSDDLNSFHTARKILVVDDNQDGAESMVTMLALLGNEVHAAYNGIEAVETAERIRPDLILMDIGMPQLNGLDATRQIRGRPWGSTVTIIALTGWGRDGDRDRSREAGCNGHLVKPVNLPDLEKLLAELPQAKADGY